MSETSGFTDSISNIGKSHTQSGNLDEVQVTPKKNFLGRKVEKLRITIGRKYDNFTRTLKNFFMRRKTSIGSATEKLSEKFMQAKWSVSNKLKRSHYSELLLTKEGREAWLTELGDATMPKTEKLNFNNFVTEEGIQDSLRKLVNSKPLTRALIRNKKLSVDEALAIHTYLSQKGINALENSAVNDIKPVMQSKAKKCLDKLPGFNGVTYSSIEAFEVKDLKMGDILKFPDYKVTAKEKYLFNQKSDVMLIIKSNKGKHVQDLADLRELGPVMFPPNTQFEVYGIKAVAGRTQITLRDCARLRDKK